MASCLSLLSLCVTQKDAPPLTTCTTQQSSRQAQAAVRRNDKILRLTELIANQQQQIGALQQVNANQVGSEKIIESLSTGIDEFHYDSDGGLFFESWYARSEDVFKENGKHLDDKAKRFAESSFQIEKLSSDQFKTLRFVCGLQTPRDSDIRTRLIGKLEGEETAPPADGATLKLGNLVEECNRITNLKQDTKMIEKGCSDRSIVKAIYRHSTSRKEKLRQTNCWFCGDLHNVKECPYQSQTCVNCKWKGQEEGYCSSSEKKPAKKVDKPKPKHFIKFKGITVERIDLTKNRKYTKIEINGSTATLQLDCASDITIFSKQTWIAVGKPVINSTEVIAVSASGDNIDILESE
ncbi:uncharacterized protein LOC135710991 [Ochlerotatus camptorhynchus]|uniref:uncharacterized protein LOC135710991 n=1 Tax=Ochlerotatus camptorhynchus TaxID=644619 RepID=UPI0031E2081B